MASWLRYAACKRRTVRAVASGGGKDHISVNGSLTLYQNKLQTGTNRWRRRGYHRYNGRKEMPSCSPWPVEARMC